MEGRGERVRMEGREGERGGKGWREEREREGVRRVHVPIFSLKG